MAEGKYPYCSVERARGQMEYQSSCSRIPQTEIVLLIHCVLLEYETSSLSV